MCLWIKQVPASGEFQKRHAFLYGAVCDTEEVSPVGLGETSVALGDACGDGEGGTVELVSEEIEAAGEAVGQLANTV